MIASSVRVFKALSDATRLRLLNLLSAEELNVAEICEVLGQPQPTISRQLAVLKEARLLRDRRDGPWVYYSLNTDSLDADVRKAWDSFSGVLAGGTETTKDRERLSRILKRRREQGRRFFEAADDRDGGTRQSRLGDLLPWRSVAGLVSRENLTLDLGTGTGDLLPYLAPRAGSVIALDFSARMLQLARNRAAASGLENVSYVRGELESIPLSDGAVDGVVASLVLHHASRPAEAVKEMARVLRKGGRAVLVDFLPHREEWLREEEGDVWLGFEPAAIRGWCEKAGFDHVLVEEGPPPARSGRRDRPGADRRLKRLGLLWVEAVKSSERSITSGHSRNAPAGIGRQSKISTPSQRTSKTKRSR